MRMVQAAQAVIDLLDKSMTILCIWGTSIICRWMAEAL